MVPALGRWKQAHFCELKAGLQSEFQDSQSCTEKPCPKTPKIEVYSEDEWDMSPGPSFLMVIFMIIDRFLAMYSKEIEVLFCLGCKGLYNIHSELDGHSFIFPLAFRLLLKGNPMKHTQNSVTLR